jgi:lactoylglutathione lyase
MRFALDHNNINVLKLEKSIAFYKEAQGLSASREINAADGSFKIVFLSDASGS